MIGIVCSGNDERGFSESFNYLCREFRSEKDEAIVVFTFSNINYREKTVKGKMITGSDIEDKEVALPGVIFNFGLQRTKYDIKARKLLEEMDDVKLMNNVNRFDQKMVMDILKSSRLTKEYLLPFHLYNKEKRDYKPDEDLPYIAIPARGVSISRVIFAQPEVGTDRLGGTQYFKKGHICDYIDASRCQMRWLFLEALNLVNIDGRPVIIRNYLQKYDKKNWTIIGKDSYPEEALESTESGDKIEEAAMTAIKVINKFMPELAQCLLDFVLDEEGKPYFLHLGGIGNQIFIKRQNDEFYRKFYENMMNLAGCYGYMQKED